MPEIRVDTIGDLARSVEIYAYCNRCRRSAKLNPLRFPDRPLLRISLIQRWKVECLTYSCKRQRLPLPVLRDSVMR